MIRLIKSTFYKENQTKKELVKFIISADKLSFGAECEKFEKNFAKFQNSKYCVFFNSGSSANLALIQALININIIKKGNRVGFSSLTWATNVMPIIQNNLYPVPIDVEINTLNVSKRTLIEAIKVSYINVLFLTNLLGFCDNIDEISYFCKKNNIVLIEDNCESLGSEYGGKKLGNFGLASTFSFYVGHHMSTIEGGAVCTNNKELAIMLKIVRAHGWDRNLSNVEQKKIRKDYNMDSDFYGLYTFYNLGYNLRPTEINGFLGNCQLKYISQIIKKRNNNFIKFAKEVYNKEESYYPLKFNHMDFLSSFSFPIICKTEEIKNNIIKKCKDKIEVRPIVGGNMTKQPFFKKNKPLFLIPETPNSDLIHKQGLYFGNNPELTNEELNSIIKICN